MVFSSTIFLFLFLPSVLIINYLLKAEYRNIFLLIASFIFYAWGEPKFIFIMFISIVINYLSGLMIDYAKKHYGLIINRLILAFSIIANLSILFYFKYFNFFVSSVNGILGTNISLRNIALPIGISFFTFQGMSYVIDLYNGNVKVQKNLLNVALYVALFPQLIAGPIVRYIDVNEQIDQRTCDVNKFAEGIRRFSIGLAKKVIIANQTGWVTDQIFALPAHQNTFATAWLGIICYALQIYFDFSGYSDMAIGLGKMLGFDFLENFNYPYISKSVTEFWRRWHISLSTWFRDYIYIPLGGNRTGNVYFNLLVVFLATGLWYGAAWNFVIWGLWHGLFLIIERVFRKKDIKVKLPAFVKWAYTMLVVLIGWVLFRAPDLKYALEYIRIMFGFLKPYDMGFNVYWYLSLKLIVMIIIGMIASVPVKKIVPKVVQSLENTYLKTILLNIYTILLLGVSIMYVMISTYNPFIYFRF